jgi:hypothetical protein
MYRANYILGIAKYLGLSSCASSMKNPEKSLLAKGNFKLFLIKSFFIVGMLYNVGIKPRVDEAFGLYY